jgi:hypothetical protein
MSLSLPSDPLLSLLNSNFKVFLPRPNTPLSKHLEFRTFSQRSLLKARNQAQSNMSSRKPAEPSKAPAPGYSAIQTPPEVRFCSPYRLGNNPSTPISALGQSLELRPTIQDIQNLMRYI